MKVKEAAKMLKELKGNAVSRKEIQALYYTEVIKREQMRSHGKDIISIGLLSGVLNEMDIWIEKVCRELGWSEHNSKKAKEECRKVADFATRRALWK